jgi:D-alanyl-D-alanine carboxypeptidase
MVAGGAAMAIWHFSSVAVRVFSLPQALAMPADFRYGSWPALSNPDFFKQVKDQFLAEKIDFVEADLTAMKIRLYKGGVVMKDYPILTKGRPGSWWETPAGLYKIESREKSHFSSFGKVYQPWSMAFQGNFFIHGWPYYPDGKPVSSAFSGGCIRLADSDAKDIFEQVVVGTPVLVYTAQFSPDDFTYAGHSPRLNAPVYLAADLRNNFVFAESSSSQPMPIASVTKLVTALVAAEYINLDKDVTITPEAVVPTTIPRLKGGETIRAYDLFFPLLSESSNQAAEALAVAVGRSRFISLMNQKAKALGMTDTHFVDPSGAGEGNISSPRDLFLLLKYLYNNRSFILNISSGRKVVSAYGDQSFADLKNFNLFSDDPSFVGGKIGKTTAAHETMAALFKLSTPNGERPIAVIVLGSSEVGGDMGALWAFVRNNYSVPVSAAPLDTTTQ